MAHSGFTLFLPADTASEREKTPLPCGSRSHGKGVAHWEEILFDEDSEWFIAFLADCEDVWECSEVADAELGIHQVYWLLGEWPRCTCGGTNDEVGHAYDCDMAP